ncbi:MAG: HD domain-containing protein [Pseudomonadales bacterium]|nr:HD domain-containing protein [Pseudomonadales bacterium]
MTSPHDQVGAIQDRSIFLLNLLGDFKPESQPLSRLDHSLQMASRARADGHCSEIIVACLFHDVGHIIPGCNHAQVAADFLKPFVSTEIVTVLRFHTLLGQGSIIPNALENCEWCPAFIELDAISWDPNYPSLEISDFFQYINSVIC